MRAFGGVQDAQSVTRETCFAVAAVLGSDSGGGVEFIPEWRSDCAAETFGDSVSLRAGLAWLKRD